MENMDLIFAQIGDLGKTQSKLETQFEMSTKVMEQFMEDQKLMAKQLYITGQAVAQLTLNQDKVRQEEPPSPTEWPAYQGCRSVPAEWTGNISSP